MTLPTSFHKVLIANRGEIALRVMRSARALGYRTVAVYSTADEQARHVSEADEAVCIGDPLPAQSYLRIPAIIEAARKTGADAVHPGYGFLAENDEFARACRDAGLIFIGPSPEAIVAMGNKAGAKRLMQEAGVPCIPGYQGEDQDEDRLAAEAARIGFPVMIKATAGGGGRGMRLVESAAGFRDLLRSAQSEAQNAFGSPDVILERAIIEPRHIEIQVFADRYGNAIHLGERDCSVQRRHQKVIEEAPSPVVDAELRARMGETAVAAVKAIGYEGAGTLEFLLDADGDFYFMEMNTRLQVEHPVTEAITGLDLVELQLRVAAGEPLPLRQSDVMFSGHAIEVRLCAEDTGKGFMPQSGVMALWQMPTSLRVEHALQSGADIPPYYDSMIAKLVSHGRTRDEARRKLLYGLGDTTALGVTTNQTFLMRCLRHPVFAQGQATTSFIVQHQDELAGIDADISQLGATVAAWLLLETSRTVDDSGKGGRLVHSLPLGLRFDIGGTAHAAQITQCGANQYTVQAGEHASCVKLIERTQDTVRFMCDDVIRSAAYHRDAADLFLRLQGMSFHVRDQTRDAVVRESEAGSDGKVRALMNGRVVAVLVEPGERVTAGQPMVTLEAMKMEHVHVSSVAGTVYALHVAPGDQVHSSRLVAEVTPDATAEKAA
jgi:geranyl-CoA carboxylase alpha subunit